MRLLSILILSKIIIGRSVFFSENQLIIPFLVLKPFSRLSPSLSFTRTLIIVNPSTIQFRVHCNKNKTQNETIEHTSNIILSMCLAFNSFVFIFLSFIGLFYLLFPNNFQRSLYYVMYTYTHSHREKKSSNETWFDYALSVVFCHLSIEYIHTHTATRTHKHDEIVSCVRIKVVRAHAAVIGNKSHKWKYSRKVGINGLNEFTRAKRAETERSVEIVHGNIHIQFYATKTAACSIHVICEL